MAEMKEDTVRLVHSMVVGTAVVLGLSLALVGAPVRAQEDDKDKEVKAEKEGAGGAEEGEAKGSPTDPKEARAMAVLKSIDWKKGPVKVDIGDQAQMDLPEGYVFTGAAGARKMLELMENPTDGTELGLLTTTKMEWFIIFEFSDIGYVKDADKEKLDGDEILSSIKEGTEQSNKERQRRGWPTISIVGWHTAPFYDPQTKNLQWCIKGESQGHTIINYNTRILGRSGVMSANLMESPEQLGETLPKVKALLAGSFGFKEGKRYSEYKKGDRIAEYGLAALVVGGAAGVAAKLGLFAKLGGVLAKMWKLVLVALIAIGAGIKALFTRRREQPVVAQVDVGDQPPSDEPQSDEPPSTPPPGNAPPAP